MKKNEKKATFCLQKSSGGIHIKKNNIRTLENVLEEHEQKKTEKKTHFLFPEISRGRFYKKVYSSKNEEKFFLACTKRCDYQSINLIRCDDKPYFDSCIHNKIMIDQKSNPVKIFFDIHMCNKIKTSQESSFFNDRGTSCDDRFSQLT
jgi:hypothetical protein